MSMLEYSAQRVAIGLFGHSVTGVADGTFLTITPTSDLANFHEGARGESATSIIASKSADIDLVLFQNSETNAFLVAMLEAFEAGGSWPKGAMVVKDPTAAYLPVLEDVQFKKRVNFGRGQDQENVTWSFRAGRLTYVPQTTASRGILAAALSAATIVSAIEDLINP